MGGRSTAGRAGSETSSAHAGYWALVQRRARPRRGLHPPRFGRAGVSEVLGVIMLVAITVILAVVLYALVSNMGAQPPQALSLNVTQGPVTANATNTSRNDTYFTVNAQGGPGSVMWNDSSFEVLITAANGTELTAHQVQIVDVPADGKATSGDRVYLHGMTGAYHGAKFRMMYQGKAVCDVLMS